MSVSLPDYRFLSCKKSGRAGRRPAVRQTGGLRYAAGTGAALGKAVEVSERSLQILIVDDEATVRHVLEFVLRAEGHRVETAADGSAALRAITEQHFDLVISDLRMPQLRGDQLAAVIKSQQPEIPVIILTGNANLLDIQNHVADAVLEKPFPVERLRELVRDFAGRT